VLLLHRRVAPPSAAGEEPESPRFAAHHPSFRRRPSPLPRWPGLDPVCASIFSAGGRSTVVLLPLLHLGLDPVHTTIVSSAGLDPRAQPFAGLGLLAHLLLPRRQRRPLHTPPSRLLACAAVAEIYAGLFASTAASAVEEMCALAAGWG
jgi:hypothetical protein